MRLCMQKMTRMQAIAIIIVCRDGCGGGDGGNSGGSSNHGAAIDLR